MNPSTILLNECLNYFLRCYSVNVTKHCNFEKTLLITIIFVHHGRSTGLVYLIFPSSFMQIWFLIFFFVNNTIQVFFSRLSLWFAMSVPSDGLDWDLSPSSGEGFDDITLNVLPRLKNCISASFSSNCSRVLINRLVLFRDSSTPSCGKRWLALYKLSN